MVKTRRDEDRELLFAFLVEVIGLREVGPERVEAFLDKHHPQRYWKLCSCRGGWWTEEVDIQGHQIRFITPFRPDMPYAVVIYTDMGLAVKEGETTGLPRWTGRGREES